MKPSVIGALAAMVFQTCLAMDDCPVLPPGVHESGHGHTTTYSAVAKAVSLGTDEESFSLAEGVAQQEAKQILMNHLSPGAKSQNFEGLVVVSNCRLGLDVFVTVRLDKANAQRAVQMRRLMDESLKNAPSP